MESKLQFEGKKVKVSFDKNIDSEKLSIKFTQGTWNVTLFPLFQDNKIVEKSFPIEPGIYNLIISYSDNLYYNEIALYKVAPALEKLSFDFYQDSSRFFCKINSDYASELNKEIVLNQIDEEIKNVLNTIEE